MSVGSRSQTGSWVPVPHSRRLDGQTGRAVAETFRTPGRIAGCESFEHGAAQPGIDEALDIAGGLELVRHDVVGPAPAFACGRILNARGHADEDDDPARADPRRVATCRATRAPSE